MNLELWLDNLWAFSLQIAGLVALGAIIPLLFRLEAPRIVHTYWRVVLLVCLLTPLLQPWVEPELSVSPVAFAATDVPLLQSPATQQGPVARALPIDEGIALILVSGIVLRLLWLILGLFRLKLFRSKACLIGGVPKPLKDLQQRLGVLPRMYLSDRIQGPATFGVFRPTILFPVGFSQMQERLQVPIGCHELVHVRRRDWLFSALEEVVLAFFWFHPAIWWLVGRIRFSREQVVDEQVIQLTESRKPYLEALFEMASSQPVMAGVLCPLLLQEPQLTQRVRLMLKEVSMSRKKLILSLVTASGVLALGLHLVAWTFPLTVPHEAPQGSERSEGEVIPLLPPDIARTRLLHRVNPIYPEEAEQARIQGLVELEGTINEVGEVSNVRVLRGQPLFYDVAKRSVRQWRYAPLEDTDGKTAPFRTIIRVNFVLEVRDGELPLRIDEAGSLWDSSKRSSQRRPESVGWSGPDLSPLEGQELAERVSGTEGSPVSVRTFPEVSYQLVSDTLTRLQQLGAESVEVNGSYISHQGQLFYTLGADPSIRPPEINLDAAKALARSEGVEEPGSLGSRILVYQVFLDELGNVVWVRQLRGPEMPQVEAELTRTPAIRAAYKGNDSVPVTFFIELLTG